MVTVAVRERRDLDADPAAVWALVADPERVGEWAPVYFVGWMGTNMPAVGHAFFISLVRPGGDPYRLAIEEWDAGHRFRCAVQRDGVDGLLDVIVDVDVEPGGPRAALELRFSGDFTSWSAPVAAMVVRRKLRRALVGAAGLLES